MRPFLLLLLLLAAGLGFVFQGDGPRVVPASVGPGPSPADTPEGAHVNERTRHHILDGDGHGGGHRAANATGRETPFPQDWSDDRIIGAIEDLANDPAARRRVEDDGRTVVSGFEGGVRMRAVIAADGRTIITGYPLE